MAQFTKDFGRMEWRMEEGALFMLMGMSTKGNGRMIKPTERESTLMQTALSTKDSG